MHQSILTEENLNKLNRRLLDCCLYINSEIQPKLRIETKENVTFSPSD